MAYGHAGDGRTRLQTLLNNLGFEWFGVRASLAHGNPGDKGYRVRLKIRGHHRPYGWSSEGDLAGRLSVSERASHLAGGHPVVRQQLGQGAGLLRRQAREHVLQVGVRIMPVQAG